MSKRTDTRSEIKPSAQARHLWNFLMARGGRGHSFDNDALVRITAERISTGHRNDGVLVGQLVDQGWVEPTGAGSIRLAL